MGISLYEISTQYRDVLAWDIDSEPDAEALAALLDEVAGRFEDKAAAVVGYMRNVEAEAAAYETEAKRLKEVGSKLMKRADSLKGYLTDEMRRCQFDEVNAGFAKLKFVKNPWSVEIEPNADLPNQYLRFRDPEPDKTTIAVALQAGEEIPGCRLVQTTRLRIS